MDRKTVLLLVLIVIVSISFTVLYEEQEDSLTAENQIFYTDSHSIMDTTVTISIYDFNEETAVQTVDRAFVRVGDVDDTSARGEKNLRRMRLMSRLFSRSNWIST